jgi:putative peptidoglycan lipid II flippase
MGPRTLVVGARQIDATLDGLLASLIGPASITVFNYGQQLQMMPLGLFCLPIAQAALPTLSEYAAQQRMTQFKEALLSSLHQIMFLILPASALLIVLREQVVRLIYGADQFGWEATNNTSNTILFFAISLFAQAIVQLFGRSFFALHDSKTPVIISLISIGSNALLSILFIIGLQQEVWFLALSSSIASIIQAILLLICMDKKVRGFNKQKLIVPFVKIIAATGIMAVFLYVPLELFDELVFDTSRTLSLLMLTGVATCSGLVTYIFFAWFFNIKEIALFLKFARKLARVKNIFFEPQHEVGELGGE